MPFCSSPSIVVIFLPSCIAASVMQDRDAPAIDVHGAGAALAAIACLLRAGQRQLFAQRIEQRHARLNRDRARLAVDSQVHGDEFEASLAASGAAGCWIAGSFAEPMFPGSFMSASLAQPRRR